MHETIEKELVNVIKRDYLPLLGLQYGEITLTFKVNDGIITHMEESMRKSRRLPKFKGE